MSNTAASSGRRHETGGLSRRRPHFQDTRCSIEGKYHDQYCKTRPGSTSRINTTATQPDKRVAAAQYLTMLENATGPGAKLVAGVQPYFPGPTADPVVWPKLART